MRHVWFWGIVIVRFGNHEIWIEYGREVIQLMYFVCFVVGAGLGACLADVSIKMQICK